MNEQRGALTGVRVLELSGGIASSFAARILGDFGAEVIKVEPLAGDELRKHAPFMDTADGAPSDVSALFTYLNWNKRSVVVDSENDPAALQHLLSRADIVILGDDKPSIAGWTIVPSELHADIPELTVLCITPFGLNGPQSDWSSSELILQAMSGLMAISGSSEREPLMRGLRQSNYTAGINAAYLALASYFSSLTKGTGALIDLAIRDVLSSELVFNQPTYAFLGAIQARQSEFKDPLTYGEPLLASDAYVTLQTSALIPVSAFAEILGDERLKDARFATAEDRLQHVKDLINILEEAITGWEGRALFQQASDAGLLAGFVQTAQHLLDCPQLQARQVWAEVPNSRAADGQPWKLPAGMVSLSRTPVKIRSWAPELGQDTITEMASLPVGSVR
ncbi:hypothetical protein AU252_01590 [Pseudarthrobacter sulfonivorans]|uniref:Carnitine dehydratase n=1 Tax=Pseudarthrobacter sulfonivorans TaxID=121292 RepID=A0A0U3P741_9MICC|nr:CoA transferase [Pseudarthrobacter sulfonivorans]ALV40019.1 hypothetical protein AU252_01590 [Pseudarthrobacter sulfonivorans]